MSFSRFIKRGRGAGGRRRALAAVLAALALVFLAGAIPALADFGDFGSSDPPEPGDSPRVDTPNDPDFDRCETDDEEAGKVDPCGSYWEEQFGAFGFSPDSARDLSGRHTAYDDCSQLDSQGREANRDAGDPECSQISGVRADTAWKYSTGDPETVIAVLDSGIEWQEEELAAKVQVNTAELPAPEATRGEPLAGGVPCDDFDGGGDDLNYDGAVNVLDFACDARVEVDAGDVEADDMLEASDLIAELSDGVDDDGNGYVDDIAGWDFFDDDNDPFDASSCCNPERFRQIQGEAHGTDRMLEAARSTDEGVGSEPGIGEAGICPDCQVMPLRTWDSFVQDTNFYALGLLYAADNGAAVAEGAIGGVSNSDFARRAFEYADRKGMALLIVSSDTNSASHNYPTNYNEAIFVAGSLPDSAPSDCGISSLPVFRGPDFSVPGCSEFFRSLSGITDGATPPSTQLPTTSFFRNSNLSQYGGKADIVMVAATGSENTGQAAGAAGLLAAYGRQVFGDDDPLTGNEIRQLLTMTAEDVLPENTGTIGLPDKASPGWDSHFGYGRVNLAGAMARIEQRRIPPEAQLDSPDWFAPINVDRIGPAGVPVFGRAAAPHGEVGSWEVEYACGQDARDSIFKPIPGGVAGSGAVDGLLGRLPRALLVRLAESCDGSVRNDAGRPAGSLSDPWPADPYPDPDPERHAFQIRLTVHEAGDAANFGRYRKTLFAYHDDGNRPGWPRPIGPGSDAERLVTGSAGETTPRLFDLDGDNRLDVVLGTSSGRLYVLDSNGAPLQTFNGGEPVLTRRYAPALAHATPSDAELGEPREVPRHPAIGDLDGDGEPEIVATAGEHIYAWHRDGSVVGGFPERIDPSLSEPCVEEVEKPCFDAQDRAINKTNHVKRGFLGAPALANLDRDRRLEIVAGSLDQHLYAIDDDGERLQSFNGGRPLELADERATAGAEIATSPAIANLDGDRSDGPEIVIATNEVLDAEFAPPEGFGDVGNALVRADVGANVVYAVGANGEPLGGEWPVELGTVTGDLLPMVGPGNDAAALNADGDRADEVAVSALSADAKVVDGDGSTFTSLFNDAAASPNVADQTVQVNALDYPSVGELLEGTGPSVIKGGLSLGGTTNLLASNQNLLSNHSVQAWNPRVPETAPYRAGFPTATDDFQFVTQPAIAKVDAAGDDRQALVGTGLYQLHAYGPGGSEPPGWPKFLGGWVQPTAAVGDVDGDGRLEVAAVTREGWSFLFDTGAPACQAGGTATNQEWWTFGHDEFGTHNYRADARPPSRPGSIVVRSTGGNGRLLTFEASGDDLLCGKPSRYEVRGSDRPIVTGADFEDAAGLGSVPATAPSGGRQQIRRENAGRFDFVAVRAVDDAGNVGYLRSAPTEDGGG